MSAEPTADEWNDWAEWLFSLPVGGDWLDPAIRWSNRPVAAWDEPAHRGAAESEES